MPATHRRRWSRADVLALMEASPLQTPRYEVVGGELFVTPSPSGFHQLAVLELAHALKLYCDNSGIGETWVSPFDVDLEGGGLVQPDVFVTPPAESRRLRQERTARTLILAAEVLSPSSIRGDRGAKRRLYNLSVPVYWTVNVAHRLVEEWRVDDGRVRVERVRLRWHPVETGAPFELDLQQYFAKVYGV